MKLLFAKFILLALLISVALLAVRQTLDLVTPLKTRSLATEVEQGAKETGEIDVVIAGTSHALAMRDLGIDSSYRILNLSQPGLGISPMLLKLEYTISKAKCRNVVLVVDNWQIASKARSQYPRALDAYEFDFDLYRKIPNYDIGNLIYARYPLGLFGNLPSLAYSRAVGFNTEGAERRQFIADTVSVGSIAPDRAASVSRKLYSGSLLATAEEYSATLVKSCRKMQEAGVRVLVISPPLPQVFRDQAPPDAALYKETLVAALKNGDIEFLDLSAVLPEDEHYSDPNHLHSTAARKVGRAKILPLLNLD